VPEPNSAGSARQADAKSSEVKPAEARPVAEAKPVTPVQRKRRVARSHAAPQYGYGPSFGRPMLVAQQPHFGMFGNTW